MSEDNLVHGFKIDGGSHYQALAFMKNHMSREQVERMVHSVKGGGHGFPFMVTHNGTKVGDYKLELEGSHLVIHHASY